MFALRQSIRLTSAFPRSTRAILPCTPHLRTLRTTTPVRADMSDMADAFAKSPLFEIMKNNPGAVEALKEAGEVAKKKGVDMSSPPSKMTMMSLAFDSDFRAAIEKLMKELKNAGVDVTPQNLQNMMGQIGQDQGTGQDREKK